MATEKSTVMENLTQMEDKVDIKIESNEFSTEIKFETDNSVIKDDNPFQDVQLELKEELPENEQRIEEEYPLEYTKNIEKTKDTEAKEIDVTELKTEEFTLKLEREQEVLSEEDPSQDEGSMDSDNAVALHNVEACLEDEEIKTEDYVAIDHNNAKYKMDLCVTETNLISNKLIKTTSTVTMPCEGVIESQTTKTLIMEIHPMVQTDGISRINPEVILPTNEDAGEDIYDDFQLNSITGDILPLEQELLQAKKKLINADYQYVCPKCPKVCSSQSGLRRHLSVHDCIERRARGVMQGIQTRIQRKNMNMYKKVLKKEKPKVDVAQKQMRKDRLEKRLQRIQKSEIEKLAKNLNNDNNYKIEIEINDRNDNVKREGYVCVCGQVFKRKSRMETCRRSHEYNDTDMDSTCHSCVSCSKQFKDKQELITHRKRLHRKRFPCKFCPTDYNTRKELFKHLQIHQAVQLTEYKVISEVVKGRQKMKCFMCSNSYTELSFLKSHIMEEHKPPYTCQLCNEHYSKIVEFCNHIKTNHPDIEGQPVLDVLEAFSKLVKAWKCEECDLQFHEADKLAKHQIEQHSPEMKSDAQFQCSDCHRMFVSQKGLTSHARIHHSIENIESEPISGVMCVECRKICKDMDALTSHMRLHSPERKYPCKFCDFRFTTPEKRKAHAEIHTGDMKFVCFICEYQCSSENRLKQHKMSLKHANMKEFLLTGKPLLQEEPSTSKKEKDEAKKRKKDTSSDDETEVMCDICGEKFSSKKKMLKHKNSHPFIEFPNEDTPTRIFFK
ncbi:zinc finger protein 91-like [Aricia agestis]|uniref:zinc finger protein 91-like n=1 Tax=Aricia agestis TaxID=91739 RepID=UPI001C2025E7|nr:zinc finger protein 91-like [Aricia agestis]XP_041985619.1 zinc finger protein 91-like [Aricia agestis]XP_041985620.1 zinc finger protein 91-like [Aricia agestis]